jgi:hypothetical protein
MADKTWFGGTGAFGTASDWSPSGVPVAGDRITLGTGTLEVSDLNLIDIPMTMGSYYGATLDLENSILGDVALVTAPTPTGQIVGHHTFDISGFSVFAGTISTNPSGFSGGGEFSDDTTINIDRGSTLLNIGNIELTPQEGVVLDINGDCGSKLVNDGLIEAESGPDATVKISTDVLGFGTIAFGVGAPSPHSTQSGTLEFTGRVGTNQTVEFSAASPAMASDLLLQIDIAHAFKGTIANFTNTDTISLQNTTVTSDHFSHGVLTLDDGSHAVAHLHFAGSYTTSDFTTAVVGGDTLIKLT